MGEVEGPAWMTHQPFANLGMLVGGVVVGDGMDEFAGRHGPLDRVEEADELLMAVLLHAKADDLAVQHVERGRQRGGAVSDVVVCMVPQRPFFNGRPGCVRPSACIWLTWGPAGQDVRISVSWQISCSSCVSKNLSPLA